MEKQLICQSCGMPMTEEGQFGRNSDGSKNEEYCCYCMKDGELGECTLEQMIDICAPIEVKAGVCPDEETARRKLAEYLPTLKRWRA